MATTYTPQYSTLAGAIVRRGGGEHLDRDVSAGDMGRDARGRPALARGPQRLVSRVVRALLTDASFCRGGSGSGCT